jgi:hypothetical protein
MRQQLVSMSEVMEHVLVWYSSAVTVQPYRQPVYHRSSAMHNGRRRQHHAMPNRVYTVQQSASMAAVHHCMYG